MIAAAAIKRASAAGVLAGALALGAPGTAATPPYRLDGTSIGGIRLGLSAAQYRKLFRERPIVTRFAGGVTRLVFDRRELHVYLGRKGRGIGILTRAREYRTAKGVGPCSSLAKLRRAYRGRLRAYRSGPTRHVVAYRLGRLVFGVASGFVGNVMLATPRLPVRTAVNAPQCGVGEVE
jgi:hypothetical protein